MNVTMNGTFRIDNSTGNAPRNILQRHLVEWQIIVLFSIHGVGLILNILNQVVLCKGFSDTIMLRFVRCISTLEATYCTFTILSKTFQWWNYVQQKWIVEIYYYVIVYGKQSLQAILVLMFIPLAIDRIKAANRKPEEFAQKYQPNTRTKTVFIGVISAAVMIGLVCSLPIFYVHKIREAYHEGDSVYTVMYVKPKPKIPCTRCMQIKILIDETNFETLHMFSKNIITQLMLCICLIVFIIQAHENH